MPLHYVCPISARSFLKNVPTCVVFAVLLSNPVRMLGNDLGAPVVKSDIEVRWDSSKKRLQYLKNGQPTEFGTNDVFLAKGPVNITYPRLNPLKVRATASATAVADPAVATISKLIDAITSVVTTVAPPPAPVGPNAPQSLAMIEFRARTLKNQDPIACSVTDSPATNLGILWALLYDPVPADQTVGAQVTRWINTIETGLTGGPGYRAVQQAADMIGSDAKDIAEKIDKISKATARIHECADSQSGASTSDRELYIAADLAQNPTNSAVQQLTALKTAYTQLQNELNTTFAVQANWVGPTQQDYRLNDQSINATLEKMQNVTVKVVSIEFSYDQSTRALSTKQQDAGSVTFAVRRYTFLTPEIGAGAVFGTIKKPNYGTATNAVGQTIVAKVPDTSISVNPSLMVNFVCRCGSGPLLPLLQIGASASKDLPALLVGGGLRLFGLGKGDVAIAGGGMFAFVKDLQKLKPGDVVTGTKDIDADLGYSSRPRLGGYFAILYKF